MEEKITPPPVNDGTDGSSDIELLRAISTNPECAHVLAAIAAGGDPKELLNTLLPQDDAPQPDESDEPALTTAEVPMFCSAAQSRQHAAEDSCPSFLANIRPDFWDDF